MSPDARRILLAQAARGVVYGLGSIVIGVSLEKSGLSTTQVGLVFTAMLAGVALASIVLARYGDRIGRRRAYRALLIGMACAGLVFALTDSLPLLIVAALTGTVSADIVESGPLTSLEQAMLPHAAADANVASLFGTYNTVATLAGSFGALAAFFAASRLWLLVYPIAALVALIAVWPLSETVEGGRELTLEGRPTLHKSKSIVARLSALFALDSFGGGFVVQSFIAYWFALKFGTSHQTLAIVFLAIGFIQAASFQIAVRLSHRFGLLERWSYTPALERPARRDRIRADVPRSARPAPLPLRPQPDGCAGTSGVRSSRRRPIGAHGGRRVHEHGAFHVTRRVRVRGRQPCAGWVDDDCSTYA